MRLDELFCVLKTAGSPEELDERREEIAELIPAVRTMFGYDQSRVREEHYCPSLP